MPTAAAEKKLEQLLLPSPNKNGKSPAEEQVKATISTPPPPAHDKHFRAWFLQQFNGSDDERPGDYCSLEDFAVYFLSAVRQQTEIHLHMNEIACETPKVQTPIRTQKSAASSTTTSLGGGNGGSNSAKRLSPGTPVQRSDSFKADELDLPNRSQEPSGFSNTSTPVRRHQKQRRSVGNNTSHNTSTTPTNNSVKTPSRNNCSASSNLCLGDFMVVSNRQSNKKKTPQSDTSTGGAKPKKRVVPTTISKHDASAGSGANTPFGSGRSSFSQENNILKISHTEIDDRNKCSIMQARKSLKLNAVEISKELETTTPTTPKKTKTVDEDSSKLLNVTMETAVAKLPALIDLDNIENPWLLRRMANIYSFLIELNFSTNVLNEISFLLNLLNANNEQTTLPQTASQFSVGTITEQTQRTQPETNLNSSAIFINKIESQTGMETLQNPINCIYFALRIIEQQRQLLSLLDLKSLGVVLNNERITYFTDDFRTQLNDIYQQKQQLEAQKLLKDNSIRFDTSFKNVYYHEEQDSRQHFSSNNEFGAFKTQRDLFYKTLKLWETNHLNPNWSFAVEVTPKLVEIFRQSENAINMAHFATLFVSQLLISSSDATSPEEIGIDGGGMDLQKFSKLTQRLVAPSNFSVDFQFPRNQAFFRDFISESRSLAFTEQLKMALYSELISRNDSTFELLNFGASNNGIDDDDVDVDDAASADKRSEFIVRPDVLASMLILAKFLGFVTALPYNQQQQPQATITAIIEKKQLMLRSLFQPNFNVYQLLQTSIRSGKLLVTLPWLVQYLSMLDQVTLQLDNFVEATELIFALYTQVGMGGDLCPTSPTAVFIVRCCLGWLFETKPIIAQQYYAYRVTHTHFDTATSSPTFQQNDGTMQELRLLISSKLAPELTTQQLYVTSVKAHAIDGSYACVLQQEQHGIASNTAMLSSIVARTNNTPLQQPNQMLESTLNVACPFLAEFRVSIMPAKYTMAKYVSRTGRYRHITTRLAELPSSPIRRISLADENLSTDKNKSCNPQTTPRPQQHNKLVEAFLHSQNSSMRRLMEFVVERTYKSVIKDARNKILLPSKAAADDRVNEITSNVFNRVFDEVSFIYAEARDDALSQWQAQVPSWVDSRIELALEALLPTETMPIIKQTYFQLVKQNSSQKITQWRQTNMFKNNFYCSDFNEMTQKICKANKKKRQIALSTELKLINQVPSTSDLIDDLQYWLHCTSMRPDLMTHVEPIIEFVQRLPLAFENTLPSVFYRLIGSGLVQLLQHIIARHPEFLTTDLVDAACNVWLSPEMPNASITKPNNKEFNDEVDISANSVPSIYDGLITTAFIASLGSRRTSYGKLSELLVALIQRHVITVDFVNVLFVPIFKEDWHAETLNEISHILRTIAQETSTISGGGCDNEDDDGKSQLFMEVLAEFSRDVDADF